jgi:hypothetical protein
MVLLYNNTIENILGGIMKTIDWRSKELGDLDYYAVILTFLTAYREELETCIKEEIGPNSNISANRVIHETIDRLGDSEC